MADIVWRIKEKCYLWKGCFPLFPHSFCVVLKMINLVWSSWSKITSLLKIASQFLLYLIMLYYRQTLDSVFLSTFYFVNFFTYGFVFLFGKDSS